MESPSQLSSEKLPVEITLGQCAKKVSRIFYGNQIILQVGERCQNTMAMRKRHESPHLGECRCLIDCFRAPPNSEDLQSVKVRQKQQAPNEFKENSFEKVILQNDVYDLNGICQFWIPDGHDLQLAH